jgi:hypothetical protein
VPFRHVAMFRWAEHVDTEHVQRVREAYDQLGGIVSGLRHHAHGSDVGVSEGTFDFHVVADFDSVADWRAYRDHPAHVLLVEELITGFVAEQATGQFQAPDDRDAHEVSAAMMRSLLAEPDDTTDGSLPGDESDEELLARARRAAIAEMQALLAEPDDPT